MYLKELYIKGYKKYDKLHIAFHKGINILIGENEASKSTVL